MSKRIDLNCDMGESFGSYKIGNDTEILKYITSANIACGWHAGDPLVMENSVAMAKKYNVAIGAHPGFPDLLGFGRREMNLSYDETKAYIKYQVGALMAFAKSNGVELRHVKPHGALYNMAAADRSIAEAIAQAINEVDPAIIIVGLANSEIIKAAEKMGLKSASEVFADRAYNSDGSLVSRKLPGSIIHDSEVAVNRVVRMIKDGKVTSTDGKDISITADTVCVHGDTPEALTFVKEIRERMLHEGIEVRSLGDTDV